MYSEKVTLRFAAFAASAAIAFALLFASTSLAHAATLTTDKADYFPGQTAVVYGSGFDAQKQISLTIVGVDENGDNAVADTWDVATDDLGAFTTSYTLPGQYIPLYLLAANSGDGALLAETSFTDNKNLTLTFAGTGGGTIALSAVSGSPAPSPATCTSTCIEALNNTASGTLTSAANPGSVFAGWTGSFVSGGSTTCAGTASPCTFSLSNAAQALTATFNLIVSSQTITVTTPAPASGTYADSFGVAAAASSGLGVAITTSGSCSGSGTGSATITMTSGTGTCTVHYNQAGNGSFNPAPEVTSNTTANKADPDCSATGYSATYDGSLHTATGSCAGVNGEGPLSGLDLTGTNHTNAGTYNGDAWSYPGTANYSAANGTVDDSIAKAPAGCSTSGYSGTYDGDAHGASGSCTGTGTLELGATFTDVPGGSAAWTFVGDSNHEDDSGNVAIVITQAPSTVTVDCGVGPYIYTGLTQTPCAATATGVGMTNVDVTGSFLYSNNVNAGTASANASWAGDTNHTGNTGSGSFTIEQAVLTITASSGSMIQGGTVPAVTPGYSGFVNGETSSVLSAVPTCSTTATSASAPGDYPTSCSDAAAANYSFNYVPGVMHVYVWTTVFHGLFQPISVASKTFQKNSTIPVKFTLNGGAGNFYGGEATLEIQDEATPGWHAAVASGGSNTGDIFRYDSSAGQYIYNLSTKDPIFKAGHTYDFRITMFGTPFVTVQKAVIKVQK